MSVLLETSVGDIVVDLYVDERPNCSLNFLKLCKIKYYNFCLFHDVQRNFIVQTGDPSGTGNGGESIHGVLEGEEKRFMQPELVPKIKHTKRGLISMAGGTTGVHGSQFYITCSDDLDYLNGNNTVFGEVAEGMDIVMKINDAYCDKQGRPYKDIRILHTIILDDPLDDPKGLEVPDKSPEPPAVTDSDRIGYDEDVNPFEGKTHEEVREIIESRDSKSNAQILEMVGDIPDADGRPPENVLFVCKLNPVTTAEDLEIIFSRFGSIVSCEVIKDQKTNDSLQYAFIEFEREEDCISAFFKMDNVLIDDRRIHVDFSQSLAKVRGARKRALPQAEDDVVVVPRKKRDDGYELVFDDDNDISTKIKSSKKSKTDHKSRNNNQPDKRHDKEHNSDRDHDRNHHRGRHERDRHHHRDSDKDYNRQHRDYNKDHDRHRYRDEREQQRRHDRDSDHIKKSHHTSSHRQHHTTHKKHQHH
ncbi:peptidyl-prolyl cis-trans isomerase sig-7-like [Dysidea avara]|uniref:peptidyl-prolyl cis-trans isomerase sig-7-like n=1 Tax=Dysidea avara TaxID=196820 RepID=UPI003333B20F